MNNKLIVGGIFCNLEKTFDSVNHNIIFSKLEFYGITGNSNFNFNLLYLPEIYVHRYRISHM
jgi:hypothetical protein